MITLSDSAISNINLINIFKPFQKRIYKSPYERVQLFIDVQNRFFVVVFTPKWCPNILGYASKIFCFFLLNLFLSLLL